MTLRKGNKRRDSASDIARRMKYDPLKYLIDVGRGTEPADVMKVGIAKEVLPYVYPKLRSVELSGAQLHEIVVKIGQSHVEGTQDVTHVSNQHADTVIEHAPVASITPDDRNLTTDAVKVRAGDDE